MPAWKDIGSLLREYGLINNEDLNEGLKLHEETGLRLGEALVQLGKVNKEDIDWILSKQLDIPYVIVDDITADIELLHKFQQEFLIENRVLPLYEADNQISIVIEDPFNKSAVTFIEDLFGKRVSISTGSGSKIKELLKQAFQKVGLPELIDAITTIINTIKETSFYRIDFLTGEHSCEINVFGAGIVKNMQEIKGHYSNEDIFRAFNDLDVEFLYEESSGFNRRFIAVYPLINRIETIKLPAIIGGYGLFLTDDMIFSDARAYGLSRVFPFDHPVCGYPYLATKEIRSAFKKLIYVVDAAPEVFADFYIHTYVPDTCSSCKGAGCAVCRHLGYEFNKIEGVYSSKDLGNKLKKDYHGKN